MIQYSRGELTPRVLLHIERLDELRGLRWNGRLEVGALTTHYHLANDPDLRRSLPALAEAAATVGGWQTQAVGTVGGNICNASPAADLMPPLLVGDALVTLESVEGAQTMALEDFLVGRRQTALSPRELLTAVSVEPVGTRAGEVYLKVGRRGAMEVAIVGMAVRIGFDDEGTIDRARIALCSVAPKPYRDRRVEEALLGTGGEPEAVAAAGRALAAGATPIDDARSIASYRTAVLAPLLERAVGICMDRAGVG